MANVARPRLQQTRLTLSPALSVDGMRTVSLSTTTTTHTSTASPSNNDSKGSPLLAVSTPDTPAPLARTNSRKRLAVALQDATTTRPPTKIAVTQPHGELLTITNGVSVPLGIDADEVRSTRSTPRPGSAGKLAPATTGTSSTDKRSLRSHDGGHRLKSDLATYFASYDDIIAGVAKPAEFLDLDTPIYIIDEPSRPSLSPTRSRKRKASSPSLDIFTGSIPPAQSSTTFTPLDYASSYDPARYDAATDPLADAVFFTQHRRAERKEKQLRNIEKERAMHEKVQLERLLDGLQGPDWLKVMGITGVTDGERKDWEPKRDYFVSEVEALVDKFRIWKEEEKRLRAEKEAALAAQEDSDDQDGDESEESDTIVTKSRPHAPDSHASAKPKTPVPRRPPKPHGFLLPLIPPEPTSPFQSFYSKPHLRAAALGKHRHGRNATAFGLPIPDFDEKEFDIPEEYIDPQRVKDNARQKRRRNRESKANEGTKP
ncbi:something about silencing, SAS, complex subunit 4-domain-containing protein [Phaeosphaeria sp. MPI-PUGE-AT-0046c]|nr:something about silencing, SAS, complex subunit 4-domain-containing protein [Phaeosphaeria sp. MPI-PUGE-AT-0046c]